MKNYLKWIGVSLLLHIAAASSVLCFTHNGAPKEIELLVVDFSTVLVGDQREGGAGQGSAHAQAPSIHAKPVSAPALKPKSFKETEPIKPVSREPESIGPEPVDADQSVLANTTSSTTAEPRAYLGDGQFVSGEGVESETSGAGISGGRGGGEGGGTGAKDGQALGYVKANFNYILVHIRRNLQYPDYARRAKLTGTARFAFVIKQDGTIESLRLEESSGHPELDEAAEKAIKRSAPFPNPPAPALLIIPIEFRLI